MVDSLFHKTAFITDLHFGRNGNSPVSNQDNLDFLDWAVDRAKSWGADTMIIGGDWHDSRHSIGVATIHHSLKGLEILDAPPESVAGVSIVGKNFKQVFFIPGNHDLQYREKRDVVSFEFAKYLPNIKIIKHPTEIDDVTFLPWLVGDEHQMVRTIKSRYVFSHLELPGFLMNAQVLTPDNPKMIQPEDFNSVDTVYSGHYHARQQRGKVIYTGNIMPLNYSDVDDEDRGMMLLEWGKDPIFESWPGQPLFKRVKLSSMIANTSILKPKMSLQVNVDMELNFNELQEIRDALIETYDLRKIELLHQQKVGVDHDFKDTEINFQSVDEIVIDGLLSIESSELSKETLVELYKNLA